MLYGRTGQQGRYAGTVKALADLLNAHGPAVLPADPDAVRERVEAVPGVRFAEVLAPLLPNTTEWPAPLLDAVVSAATDLAAAEVRATLDEAEGAGVYPGVHRAFRDMLAGRRDDGVTDGLDAEDADLVRAVLTRLTTAERE
jgi:hypothetical protein